VDNELELINDGEGIAIIGNPHEIELFLSSKGLESKELDISRVTTKLNAASNIAQTGSEMAANSARWVKLTEKSAKAMSQNPLMKGSSPEVSRAIVTNSAGKTQHIVEFVKTPGTMLTNPAILSGAAGIMAQMAMQQTMDEIVGYLQTIDEKVDDILRAQKDAVIADVVGVGMALDEALMVRTETARVSEITWSKLQSGAITLATTQAYALRQLDALAEKMERKAQLDDVAKHAQEVEQKAHEWLAVIARCFQLNDTLSILELDRVLDHDATELEQHRRGLQLARQKRLDQISERTAQLLNRIQAAVGTANSQVLLHPVSAKKIVQALERASEGIGNFRGALGLEHEAVEIEARAWREAAIDTKDKVLTASAEGIGSATRFGGEKVKQARSVSSRLSENVADRVKSLRNKKSE